MQGERAKGLMRRRAGTAGRIGAEDRIGSRFWSWLTYLAVLLLGSGGMLTGQVQTRVLVDHVGYEAHGPKRALVMGLAPGKATWEAVDDATGQVIAKGDLVPAGSVEHWSMGPFWTADFSEVEAPGHYRLQVRQGGPVVTATSAFAIEPEVLERETLSNVLFYFKGQRVSGAFDRADAHLLVPGLQQAAEYVDLRGGWYDATGDYGVHLSHQNPTSFFNPQQVPLVAWSLLRSYQLLQARHRDDFTQYERRLLDEGLYGADFLTRMQRPGGSFFESLSAPGPGKLASDREVGNPNWKTQIKRSAQGSTEQMFAATGPYAYQVSFRSGGGMAIAALALASTMPEDGDLPRTAYLHAAEAAFAFLEKHNTELLNDGKPNILDDYCALLAATELFRATAKPAYRQAADGRAASLMNRLRTADGFHDYWRADEGTRPFFHPSDAGLPVIALSRYYEIATEPLKARVLDTIRRSMQFELRTTAERNNPFGYARQLVRMRDGHKRTAFFFPHDTEAAPWWQGENARLGSLAAAARTAMPLFAGDASFERQLESYAEDQLHWILGRNPFDTSMLMGSGHGNAPYMFFRSYQYTNAPGAILNGITSAENDEDGIAFNQGFLVTGKDEDWRWTEEWLPHAAWYLYAVSLPHSIWSVA